MKKIYLFSFIFLISLASCSKDFLKSYDRRIIGTWRITDVNRVGIGGNIDAVEFTGGSFTFHDDGTVNYTDESNVVYSGNWDIDRKYFGDDAARKTLRISVANFTTQQVRSEYYDEINFTGTNSFKGHIYAGFHEYVVHFRR